MGAPQPREIVAARAKDTLDVIKNDLEPSVLSYFTDTAESILNHYKKDAVSALSATMALVCNTLKRLPSRSLLTANEGFATLLFKVDTPIRNVGYIRAMTQKTFPNLTYEDTIGWRLTKDFKGVIVDVKEHKIQVDENDGSLTIAGVPWKDHRGISIEIPKELPELQERPDQQQHSSFGGRFGNNRFGGNRNGGDRGGRGGRFGGSRGGSSSNNRSFGNGGRYGRR